LQGNPLDAVIPDLRTKTKNSPMHMQTQSPTEIGTEGGNGKHGGVGVPSPRHLRRRFTAHVRDDVVERAKNAVYWSPGLTMAELVERGMEQVIKDLEKTHGGAFENRKDENRGGRPIV
jgi:hypothetical protein